MKSRMPWKCVYALGVAAMCVASTGLFARVRNAEEAKTPAANAPAVKVQVKIDNFAFTPTELTVAAGTTVEWINRDDIPHVVVSDDKTTFKSKALDTDDKFSYTFTKPGTYSYFCSVHPKMIGKIVVQ